MDQSSAAERLGRRCCHPARSLSGPLRAAKPPPALERKPSNRGWRESKARLCGLSTNQTSIHFIHCSSLTLQFYHILYHGLPRRSIHPALVSQTRCSGAFACWVLSRVRDLDGAGVQLHARWKQSSRCFQCSGTPSLRPRRTRPVTPCSMLTCLYSSSPHSEHASPPALQDRWQLQSMRSPRT